MKKKLLPLVVSVSLSLTACSTILEHLPGVYTIDIKQGNIIDQDMIDQLRPNMTKKQVLYIMGSPMVNDFLHKQRWDYVYTTRQEGDLTIDKRIALFFKGDNLVSIEGDFKPDTSVKARVSKEVTVDVPPRKLEQTLFEKIASWFDFTSDQPVAVHERRMRESDLDPDKGLQRPIPLP